MSNLSASPQEPTLSESYTECIRSFRTLLLALGHEDCRVVRLEQANAAALVEEYGRAKIWGDQTKASLPARARGSLDDMLRRNRELKDVVHGILQRLKALLIAASRIADKKLDPLRDTDQDSSSSVSIDSHSDSEEERDGPQRHTMPKIYLLVQQILAQIRSLYSLSSLLRRPQLGGKYLRSVKAVSKDDSDSETTRLKNAYLRRCDYSHIVEKVRLWRGPTKCEMRIEFDTEEAAPPRFHMSHSDVDDISWLCERLTQANTRRREQLEYWIHHPYDLQSEWGTANPLKEAIPARIHSEKDDRAHKAQSQVSTIRPPNPNSQVEGPASKSILTKQTFSTVAVSDVVDAKTNLRPRTVYAPTAVGKRQSNSIPDVPKAAKTEPFFSCPYCGMTLVSEDMQIRASWKRHVFRDLRPYTCTFEECQSADKLFVSRNDWIYHELQVHRRQFTCRDCDKVYSDKDSMRTHLGAHYGKSILPTQLEIILDICNRQIDDAQRQPCLFCGENFSLAVLQDHLAGHMEDIALFVLPTNIEEGEMENKDKASIASALAAKVHSEEGTDEASAPSSLGFSSAASPGQNPADFANALTVKEEDYESKVSLWNGGAENKAAMTRGSDGAEGKTETRDKSCEPGMKMCDSSPSLFQLSDVHRNDAFIAVMGMKGSGKSTFIRHFCDTVTVGDGLKSGTAMVEAHPASTKIDGRRVIFVENPGFDDPIRPDSTILREIANWLNKAHQGGIKLTGIVYLHPVNNRRLTGTARNNLRMLKKMCGDDSMSSVALATTHWGSGEAERKMQLARHEELLEDEAFWKPLLLHGATGFIHDQEERSALRIVRHLLKNRPQDGIDLTIQKEMEDGITLDKTAAGIALGENLNREKETYERQINQLQSDIAEVKRDNKLTKERKEKEVKILKGKVDKYKNIIKSVEDDRELMKVDRDQLQLERSKELQEEAQRHDEMAAQLQAEKDQNEYLSDENEKKMTS